jgi:hypothetical protein
LVLVARSIAGKEAMRRDGYKVLDLEEIEEAFKAGNKGKSGGKRSSP